MNIPSPTYEHLLKAIRATRRRWRLRTSIRGLAIVLGAGFLFFAISALALDRFHYSDGAISLFRVLMWVSLVGLIFRFLVLPLWKRPDDERVALYIEEHEPSVHEEILSAVEIGRGDSGGASPALVERLLASAIETCERIDYGSGIERSGIRKFSALLAGTAGVGMLAILLSPAFFQQSALLLFLPWRGDAVTNPYSIQVAPGT